MSSTVGRWAVASCALLLGLLAGCSGPKPVTEADKIEHLLGYLASMKNVKVVLGSQELEPAATAAALREEWKAKAADIHTAKEFVATIAAFSGTTGQRYLVVGEDGTQSYLDATLKVELGRYERELWRKS